MSAENSSVIGEESEDDFDWEEVDVGQPPASVQDLQPQLSSTAVHDYYADSHELEEGPSERPHLEITIKTKGKPKGKPKGAPQKNEKAVQLAAERRVRLDCHKIHTVALLMNAKVRNKWINDPLLHARLMSLTPLALQNAFAMIHRSRVPEAAKRGRLFESAITRLADWWATNFEIEPTGHLRSRTFEEVQKTLPAPKPAARPDPKGKGKARAVEDDESDDEERYGIVGEKIRSAKSLMKHALMRRGSRDTSAQLFTALCRALGIPARLVVSLQSVPWQAGVGRPKPTGKKKKPKDGEGPVGTANKGKGKAKAKVDKGDDDDDDDEVMEEVFVPGSPAANNPRGRTALAKGDQRLDSASSRALDKGKGKQKVTPVIRLRKSRANWKQVSTETERPRPRERTPDPTDTAPVFWTEVFSRADAKWIPVDPVRVIVNKRKAFDPTPNPNGPKADRRRPVRVENRMVYVLAFEEDGYARDVTPRYAREYGAKVAKVQQGGKGRREWWERICHMVQRPFRLQRDDVEDDELQANQMTEAMPTSMAGFKDHPLYVLERHLKRDEVVDQPVELGKFRGESVYPRGNVLQLKTAENWMRTGRTLVAGAQPLKMVKQRAVTVNKKRAIEVALADQRERAAWSASTSAMRDGTGDGDEDGLAIAGEGFANESGIMQGLYAEHQTELYRPPPVVDGKVPKNDFGNIDLYVPSMLPAGAAHIPFKGTAKIARQLGFDYAEAVTGFEFKKRRAFPVITGIVVAAENEATVIEAYWEAEQDAEAKRRAKRQEQVIKRWTKLVQGLRIRQRLLEQYADRAPSPSPDGQHPDDHHHDHGVDESLAKDEQKPQKAAPGGFLAGVDAVVQPYALPRNLHAVVEHAFTSRAALGELRRAPAREAQAEAEDEGAGEEQDTEIDIDGLGEQLRLEAIDDEHEDVDVDMEDVAVDPPAPDGPQGLRPKTMQELAEEAARRADAGGGAAAEEEMEMSIPPVRATKAEASEKRKEKEKEKPKVTPARATRSARGGTSTPRANGSAKAKTKLKAKTKAKGRGTKRTRADATESDSDPGNADEDEDGAEDDDEEDGVVEVPRPSPAKRARTSALAPVPAPSPSTRVLRARKPKDASKVQAEKEAEEAFRRAVAE